MNIIILIQEHEIAERRPWADLPQDVLVSIHNKVHFADQFRFPAVCKNWSIPKNFVRCLDSLPWVLTKFSCINGTMKSSRYPFECELFDPYSQKTYNFSNYVEDLYYLTHTPQMMKSYASNYGWLLLGLIGHGSLLFLYNPFINEVIMLPHLDCVCKVATFTMDPTSPECEVLVLCTEYGSCLNTISVGRCCLSSDKKWSVEYFGFIPGKPLSVCYVNGELYCLFSEGSLKSYNLSNRCWKFVVARSVWPPIWEDGCLLMEKAGDLILSWAESVHGTRMWWMFKMDWSTICWVSLQNLNNVAFFISGKIFMSAPLEDSKACMERNYYEEVGGVACQDVYGGRINFLTKKSQEAIWRLRPGQRMMSFIEPPYVRNQSLFF